MRANGRRHMHSNVINQLDIWPKGLMKGASDNNNPMCIVAGVNICVVIYEKIY